jgi:surface protein
MSLGFGLGLEYSRLSGGGSGYNAFTIEVKTDNAGVSNADQFQFTGAEGDYDVVAKQNDTVVASFDNLSGEQTITLPSSGIYVLEVIPKEVNGFNRIQFNDGGDKLKITDIKQWGDVVWSSFSSAFWGCSNMLVTATDVPNLSSVTTMRNMFSSASSANPDVSSWNVSNVTSMRGVFAGASSANPDVSSWNTSKVSDMRGVFYRATSANPDVSSWNTSKVSDMFAMFQGASSANPDVSSWNTSKVSDMFAMFQGASSANPDTSNWDVGSVTDMRRMFENSNLSVENLTALYENWSQLSLQNNVSFGAGSTKYNALGQAGRDILVNTYNWIIEDGGQVTMLNQFSGASLGLSLDKLDKNYTGSAIKVRRSSDNNELDIGFVNNELDTASLLDFVGSGNGFVTIIYDQVGSNNMTQTTSSLQGQIVSNGSVILKGGKPCIIRSVDISGRYVSNYAPNDGVNVKGFYYVGDNEGKQSSLFGGGANRDFTFSSISGSTNLNIDDNVTVSLTKINGSATTITNRGDVFNETNKHFLAYREIDFNFNNNRSILGYVLSNFGMMTFQELVIFENTDDAVAKENNINSRYNIY